MSFHVTANINVYIHFESIYCTWIVNLFDWQSIAKAGQPNCKTLFKMEDGATTVSYWLPSLNLAAIVSQVQTNFWTNHPNAVNRLKVNVDGEYIVAAKLASLEFLDGNFVDKLNLRVIFHLDRIPGGF